jgi:hypothetical protein
MKEKLSVTTMRLGKVSYVHSVHGGFREPNCKRCVFKHCGFHQMEVCGAGRDGHFEDLYMFNLVEKAGTELKSGVSNA